MNLDYFKILQAGLSGELHYLDFRSVAIHLKNHITNFILDPDIASCYLDRFIFEKANFQNALADPYIQYLTGKVLQAWPFMIVKWGEVAFAGNSDVRLKSEIIRKTNISPETLKMIDDLDVKLHAEDKCNFLQELLKKFPSYVLAAHLLLNIDAYFGRKPGKWTSLFKCPGRLAGDFTVMLFNHYARLGFYDEAMSIWKTIRDTPVGETTCNLAAEMYRAHGDMNGCISLYKKSLDMDPLQIPVRFRLEEISSPSVINEAVLQNHSVCIYLYTFNKAGVLKNTLESLARSDIGRARIKLLLNGCTDDSRTVANAAKELFPANNFEIIETPVNIGAPAARNWLISHPDTWNSDYIAFLDDDVEIPSDWLKWFLTVAERDPRTAVVGCKIVNKGTPAEYQYLYRNVSVANNDLLKMSIHAPCKQYDIGMYDVIRETRSVMGCCHLLKTSALREAPFFDIRYSPSQVDDIDHDLELCLAGYKVYFCGKVTCVHHQSSGVSMATHYDNMKIGNCIGNDIKFFFKRFDDLKHLKNLDAYSLLPDDLRQLLEMKSILFAPA